ncbi:MAG: GGDEF domain-containing protein, partial [Oscillospiraceae bacterium]|nr:GGDEF domain-containing protein [Oscillospiraceae bacterium]
MSRNKRIDDENKGLGLTSRTDPPKWVYIALLAMYLVTSIFLSMFSRSKEVLMINGTAVPYSSFTGVLSSFANICIIMLVAYFRKLGFITSLILLLSQFPMLFLSVFIRHSYASISGFFTNFLFIVTAIMLYARNKRVADYQEQITKQATTDILTGLPNRFACSQLVKHLMKRREMFTVVAVDINGFKSINDTMGFNAGNKALSIIAERWKALADREDAETRDFICRAGGDEFVILIRGASSSDDVLSAIKRYENALLAHITIDDCDLYISASFGYANYPADGKTSDMLFNRANAAMGEVKRINSS